LIQADCDRLEQVLINLVDNAVKYSPRGGQILASLRTDGGGILVQVRDFGIGVRPGDEQAIFEPFTRADNATAGQAPGMGLGLCVCRSIVQRHGGRIWANGEDSGSRFSVWPPGHPPSIEQ
jgi:signal transduction histidine kinase